VEILRATRLIWEIIHIPTCYHLLELYAVKYDKQILVFPRNNLYVVVQWLSHYDTKRNVEGSIPDQIIFFLIYLILTAALGPGVYSASNRNEYQKHKNNNLSGE
jgi:hypothetical protein